MKYALAALLLLSPPALVQLPGTAPDGVLLDPGPDPAPDTDSPAPDGRSNPGGGSGANPGASSPTASGGRLPEGASPDWWRWWEFNKLAWSTPNRLGHARGPDEAYQVAEEVEHLRRRVAPLVAADTRHARAHVRAAAVVALARVLGEEALDDVVARFDDPSPEVRRGAILALGAAGSEKAVHLLLQIARSGLADDGDTITPRARALAVLALGLARRDGVGRHSSSFLPAWDSGRGTAELDRLGNALLLHQSLAPTTDLESVARELSTLFGKAGSSRATKALTARAAETLRFEGTLDVALLDRLVLEIDRRELEFRRSVALTLGSIGHPSTIEPVRQALAAEREYLTRGFLVLALGRLGSADSRDFLIRTLAKGDRTLRPWCALALGILARAADDDVARDAVRAEAARERNVEAQGAFLLASGIAGDGKGVALQARALRESRNARTRMHAALALSMTRHPDAAAALRGSLTEERTPLVRIAIAQALGHLGEVEDVPRLLDVLSEVRHIAYQPQIAAALGAHGTVDMLRRLVELLEAGELTAIGRGAALQAVGILLDEHPPFALTEICQRANFTVFPVWLYEPILTTL